MSSIFLPIRFKLHLPLFVLLNNKDRDDLEELGRDLKDSFNGKTREAIGGY